MARSEPYELYHEGPRDGCFEVPPARAPRRYFAAAFSAGFTSVEATSTVIMNPFVFW